MKKLILSLTGMGIALALVFASCQKEEVNKKSNDSIVQNSKNPINNNYNDKQNGHYERTIWHDNGAQPGVDGTDYGCWNTPGNCLQEVRIYGSKIKAIGDGIDENSNPYNQANISDLVVANLDFFFKYFNESITDHIKYGQYHIAVKGNINEDSRVYFLVTNQDEEIIMVRPFNLK